MATVNASKRKADIIADSITSTGNVTGSNLNISNWDIAHGWGNHASANYIVGGGTWAGGTGSSYTTLAQSVFATGNTKFTFYGNSGKMDVITDGEFYANEGASRVFHDTYHPNADKWTNTGSIQLNGTVYGSTTFDGSENVVIETGITGYNNSNWDTAYSWGNHASAGYLPSTHDISLTLSGDASGSATFTNMGNATLNVTVANDSHTHDGRYYTETESNNTFLKKGSLGLIGNSDVDFGTTSNWANNPVAGFYKTDYVGYSGLVLMTGDVGGSTSSIGIEFAYNGKVAIHSNTDSNRWDSTRVFTDAYHPNADKWTTARTHTVTLTGDVTGTASQSVDGTGNKTWTINTNVGDADTLDGLHASSFWQNSGSWRGIHTDKTRVRGISYGGGEVWFGYAGGKGYVIADGEYYANEGNSRVFHDTYHPNADKWTTARTITLGGDLTGSVTLDGSANVTLSAQVSSDSHGHSNYLRSDTTDVHQYNTSTGEAITFRNATSGGQIQLGFQQQDADGLHHRAYIKSRKSSEGNYAGVLELALRGTDASTDGNIFKLEANNHPKWKDQSMFHDGYHPNADKWTTARTLSLTGDVTGSVSWDGSANASITATVANDSHTHDTRYVQQGGTSFSGEYGMVVRVSDRNFYSDANIKFRGSDSRLTVDGIVNTPTYQVNGTTVIDSSRNLTNIYEGTFNSHLNVSSSQGIRSTGWVHLHRYASDLNVAIGNNGTNVDLIVPNGDIKLSNNGWYYSQYSSTDDQIRFNANNGGGLDVYNQTQGAFANIRAGSYSIGSTTVIDSSRNATFVNATIGDKLTLSNASRVDLEFAKTGSASHYIRKDGEYLRFRGANDSTIIMEMRNNAPYL